MKQIKLNIDGIDVKVPQGTTVLNAAKQVGLEIPTLCYLEKINAQAVCRMCVVEVDKRPNLLASCNLIATEGMNIKTHSPKVLKARKTTLELILSNHVRDCLSCERSTNCELQALANQLGVDSNRFDEGLEVDNPDIDRVIDTSSLSIVRDSGKCILCRRCTAVCQEIQTVNTIQVQNRGAESIIAPAFSGMGDALCVNCGQCAAVCPVNAIYEQDEISKVEAAIANPEKYVVVQTAPAIRAALAEAVGLPAGTLVTKKMVTALKMLGFNAVFDTNFTADLTIMEEGTELLTRLKKVLVDKDSSTKLPMTTSCSPGWVSFLENYFPELIENVSTAKSPQQMFGTVAKTYYANKMGIDPSKMVVVSIMPCTAKKYEARRPEMNSSGYQDVDYVLTTRELGKFLTRNSINLMSLADNSFDDPLGESSGAADIFANSGGVMEAALRTVHEIVTGRELPSENLHIQNLMNIQGVREIDVKFEKCKDSFKWLEGVTAKVAATSGLKNARKLMEQVSAGKSPYHFIEIMCCPGGCIGGGGQPRLTTDEIRKKRFEAILQEDEGKKLRKSHENCSINKIYEEFLGEPNSHKAHELLHTHYTKREKYFLPE